MLTGKITEDIEQVIFRVLKDIKNRENPSFKIANKLNNTARKFELIFFTFLFANFLI